MKDLAIFGAGGLGKEMLALVSAINAVASEWNVIGFFDDAFPKVKGHSTIPMLGGLAELKKNPPEYLLIALGNPQYKSTIEQRLEGVSCKFPILIHPSATLDATTNISIGAGSVITAGCRLTTDISIGRHVLLNLNTTIGHDTTIDDFVSIMPGVNIAGQVHICEKTFMGAGCNIINGIEIAKEAVIGAGAVVIHNVEAGMVMAGVPAKPIHL